MSIREICWPGTRGIMLLETLRVLIGGRKSEATSHAMRTNSKQSRVHYTRIACYEQPLSPLVTINGYHRSLDTPVFETDN